LKEIISKRYVTSFKVRKKKEGKRKNIPWRKLADVDYVRKLFR